MLKITENNFSFTVKANKLNSIDDFAGRLVKLCVWVKKRYNIDVDDFIFNYKMINSEYIRCIITFNN